MLPAKLEKTNSMRKQILMMVVGLIVLGGIFFMVQFQNEPQNNDSAAKPLTQEEKQKNAEHMTVVTNRICARFDEILAAYSDNLDNISYNNNSVEIIQNNFKNIIKDSKDIQKAAEKIEILDPRYEDIKVSLIEVEINTQLSAQHMIDYLKDPKNNTDWQAQNELVNAMILNKSAKERLATLTKEDDLK